MRIWSWEWVLVIGGLGLAWISASSLHRNGGLRHSQNPFAVQRSGYGMIIARLAQDAVNKAWHSGLETSGPCEHEHDGPCEHDADHHDGQEPESERHTEQPPAMLMSVAGLPARGPGGAPRSFLQWGIDGLTELKQAKGQRTNPHGLSEAHRKKVAADIEAVLLHSYRMDPADYGVYNAYVLFLTANELRARPGSLEQAKRVAGLSVEAAEQERENPFPWLTAASALLDQFLLDQQTARETGRTLPRAVVDDYGMKMNACLARFREIQGRAEAEQRWQAIGVDRTASAMERLHFLERAAEQFAAVAARAGR